ncbi:MAG: hypothetical protein AAGF32_04585 [Pseudomonadota bacterium]
MADLAELADACAHNLRGYAAHAGFDLTPDWLVMKLGEEVGEVTAAHLIATHRSRKPAGSNDATAAAVADEIADVVGFALALAAAYDIDVEQTLQRKWRLDRDWEPKSAQ